MKKEKKSERLELQEWSFSQLSPPQGSGKSSFIRELEILIPCWISLWLPQGQRARIPRASQQMSESHLATLSQMPGGERCKFGGCGADGGCGQASFARVLFASRTCGTDASTTVVPGRPRALQKEEKAGQESFPVVWCLLTLEILLLWPRSSRDRRVAAPELLPVPSEESEQISFRHPTRSKLAKKGGQQLTDLWGPFPGRTEFGCGVAACNRREPASGL